MTTTQYLYWWTTVEDRLTDSCHRAGSSLSCTRGRTEAFLQAPRSGEDPVTATTSPGWVSQRHLNISTRDSSIPETGRDLRLKHYRGHSVQLRSELSYTDTGRHERRRAVIPRVQVLRGRGVM